jgi:Fe-S-cluster containining protein
MTSLLGKDANAIPCGRCCPPPRADGKGPDRVRVTGDDDPTLLTEMCSAELLAELSANDKATYGTRVLPLREDGRCWYLSPDNTHCTLVDGDVDRRPGKCRDGWPESACEMLDCPKLARDEG